MKGKIVATSIFAAWAVSLHAAPFKINVDLTETPEKDGVQLAVPKGAEAAAQRYFRFAEKTHPVYLLHGYAPKAGKGKSDAIDDDPLSDLSLGFDSSDAIQVDDKDVEYIIRANNSRRSFVLAIVNRKNENLTAQIELKRGKMREPVYRRVYSEDDGKTWTTAAWQPPRASDVYPWTIDVPANTVQTVTIYLK